MLPPVLASLIDPWMFMGLALSYLPGTILRLVVARDFRTLFSWSRFQAAWFAAFWSRVGPEVRLNATKNVLPLLQGRVTAGVVPPEDSVPSSNPNDNPHPPIHGTLLELGPGSGMWVSLFSATSQRENRLGPIAKIYGVEPNTDVHPLLKTQVREAGLDKPSGGQTHYEIVPVGVESLAESGKVKPNSVDCIVTIMCLCSIPEPRKNMALLYNYLKPGGRWYVYEHVKCFQHQPWGMRVYQSFLNFLWPHIVGGCQMCRETGKWLREAGPWSQVDVHPLADEPWYYTMPHVIGVLTK